jgi:uncharacterized membrane protein YozB (DUF420 family)
MSREIPAIESVSLTSRLPASVAQQKRDGRFYLVMAIASTFLVLAGFARTFYLSSYFGKPQLPILTRVHGIAFTAWMFFFIAQTILIASNRPAIHRRLGYAGAALAASMLVLGLMVAFHAEKVGHGAAGQDPETIFLISLGDILTFSIFVALGFLWRHDREIHQRLMLLAVVAGLLAAAVPRLPLIGGNPAGMGITGLAFILAGPTYDLISRRRVHPAYLWGCLCALATLPPIRIVLAATPGWHAIAKRLTSF